MAEPGTVNSFGMASSFAHELAVGLVLPDLESYRLLVHELYKQPWNAQMEFTYCPPLLRGTKEISRALRMAGGALDKFDVYLEHGIKNRDV
ncbi:MAG: hypothetical protein ABIJ09_27595, partial [Pseudomonadota bacterium]